MLDGWLGPDVAPLNAAGLVPWVHWRGFVVLALLLVGNLFCMACPFMLVRRPAKRWFKGQIPWPRPFRSKWLALALLALFFWAYEAFDLWASPWLAAWLVLAYFVAAFVVDSVFRGAAFCKYVCPIGHFHFASAPVSPFEIAVRDAEVCASCKTKDCIRGRYADPAGKHDLLQNGCELWLFQQRKVGNLDCTFCLECVHACPHENVGFLSRTPGAELWSDRWRSGVGRLSDRPDVAALVVFLCFAAFINAFGMITPADGLAVRLEALLGRSSEPLTTFVTFALGAGLIPLVLVAGAAWWTRRVAADPRSSATVGARWAFSLVPVGFGMWLAHHLMHFLTTGGTLVPVLRSRWGASPLATQTSNAGEMTSVDIPTQHGMAMAGLVPEGWVHPISLIALEVGMLASVYVAYRIGIREYGRETRSLGAALPWMLIAIGLAGIGAWLLAQPMQMRGMLA